MKFDLTELNYQNRHISGFFWEFQGIISNLRQEQSC